MSAIILDTETTDIEKPDVVELAYVGPLDTPTSEIGEGIRLSFKPTKAISLGAMSTHHIIPSDLADCDPWPGAWPLPAGVEFIVGHNVDFDWKAIGSPNVRRICTLALSRHVYPSIDSHTLGAMIYHLYPHHMARQLVRDAHSALTDVLLCRRVLLAIVEVLHPRDWVHLHELSEVARVPSVMPFGKHKGMPLAQVPNDYKRWLLTQADVDPYLAKALRT